MNVDPPHPTPACQAVTSRITDRYEPHRRQEPWHRITAEQMRCKGVHDRERMPAGTDPFIRCANKALPKRDQVAQRLYLDIATLPRGDWYLALDLDATVFAEQERGPRWMSSAGLSIGFTHDFAKAVAR